MKKLLTLIILTVTLSVYGQTKKETQDWISEKLELNAYSDDIELFYYYTTTFSDKEIIIEDKLVSNIMNFKSTIVSTYSIPIASMNKIHFKQQQVNVWLYLSIKGNQKLIKKTDVNGNKTEYVSSIPLLLSNSINENDMKNRMSKAFIQLIKLYGGTIVEEKF